MELFTVATMHVFWGKDPREKGENDDNDNNNDNDDSSGNHDVIFRDQTRLFAPNDLGLLLYPILCSICIDDEILTITITITITVILIMIRNGKQQRQSMKKE